jgi:hypothetical protein
LTSTELVLDIGWLALTCVVEPPPVEADCVLVAGCVDCALVAGAEFADPALAFCVAGAI